MKYFGKFALTVVMLALALLLVSCGDNGSETSNPGKQTTPGTTAAIEPPKADVTSRDNGDGTYEAGGFDFSNDDGWSNNY